LPARDPDDDPADAVPLADEEREERVRRILASPSHRPADADPLLLAREDLRAVRLALEYLKPEIALRERGVRATVVVFGSTRIPEPGAARRALARARAACRERPGDPAAEGRAAVAERIAEHSRYYEVGRDFGRLVGRSGHGAGDPRVVVVTGGGPGLMEAANRGASEAGAASVGLNVTLPTEQLPNPWITPELSFQFRYFALRKLHFMLRARALVAFPGGYGTLDELFETLCLIQTHKRRALPVVLVGEAFWRRAVDFAFLAAEGMVAPEDLTLFRFAETAEEIWAAILAWYEERGISLLE
jgi:uncharacterized protein (TIGR00730 family)